MVGVKTLMAGTQALTVGFNFEHGKVTGIAQYDATLGAQGKARTDSTPVLNRGSSFELRVFVDGHMVESFFDGQQVISSVTANTQPSAKLNSAFVNTASGIQCDVTSWVVGL